MRRSCVLALRLSLVLALAGCGDSKHPREIQGTWLWRELHRAKVPPGAPLDETVNEQLAETPAIYVFKPNGEMLWTPIGRDLPFRRANWEADGRVLKRWGPDSAKGNAPKADPYQLQDDGKRLRLGDSNHYVILVRKSAYSID